MKIDEGLVAAPKKVKPATKPPAFVSPEIINQQPLGAYTEVTPVIPDPVTPPAPAAVAIPFVSPEIINQQPLGAYTILPLDPPKPSLLDRVGNVGSWIISPFESVAKLGLDAVESELKQLISKLTEYVKTAFTSVYDFIDTSISEVKNGIGDLITTAKNDIRGWVSDVHNYAAHLFDTLESKVDAIASTLNKDVKSLEHKAANEIAGALKKFEPTVKDLIADVTQPISAFIDHSEIWFDKQWQKYAGDLEDFVHHSEHWLEKHFKQYTHNIEDFISDPVKWFEENWKQIAGDLIKWVDPVPLGFLTLLPDVMGWIEWLAANPLEMVAAIAHEFRTPSSYTEASKRLQDKKWTIASAAVERFRNTL